MQVRINGSLTVSVLARFFIMQLIATNLCIWLLTVVLEATEEISHHDEGMTNACENFVPCLRTGKIATAGAVCDDVQCFCRL